MSNDNSGLINMKENKKSQSGFSLVEAVIAIFIITIALIGTAAALGYAIHFGTISRNVTTAKSIITSQIEEIEALRNSRRLDFKQIANVGSVDNTGMTMNFGGFSTGYKQLSLNPGADGVNGTDDDLKDAGKDGIFGTSDDFINPALVRSGYTKRITVTSLSNTMKKIQIDVRYFSSGGKSDVITGVCYLNDEARLTR